MFSSLDFMLPFTDSLYWSSLRQLFAVMLILCKRNLESTSYFHPQMYDILMLQPYWFWTFHKTFTFTFSCSVWHTLCVDQMSPLESVEVLPLCASNIDVMISVFFCLHRYFLKHTRAHCHKNGWGSPFFFFRMCCSLTAAYSKEEWDFGVQGTPLKLLLWLFQY